MCQARDTLQHKHNVVSFLKGVYQKLGPSICNTIACYNISKTFKEQTFVSVTGNFLTIALIAGSKDLSDKNPGLAFASEHAWIKTIKKITFL